MDTNYAVKQVAKLAGVSVRTLHLYDEIGLLKPCVRTSSGYRRYGEKELLRLQQIMFYRELDMPLKEIALVLDAPDFDLVTALEEHKKLLTLKRDRLNTLLQTVNKTVINLKNKKMEHYEQLYEGMPKDYAKAIRQEAVDKWGEDIIVKQEKALIAMPKQRLEQLKRDQKDIKTQLWFKFLAAERPESNIVQQEIERHYNNIRGFWGLSKADKLGAGKYKGLADLYVTDERYMAHNGKPDPLFATFVRNAMVCFADTRLD
jgi:DNA-binding transcriptional MerR regulator